ncbi:hypothetical protein GCM10010233_15610 [Streptomyces pseudogriseolus]|uniref:Uncharacterized protein n=1 Tax=Streptomyces pseudogriseolus TaxID=36817 RepID=A0ABQ2TKX7_STREZ|nr:hypothetical protein GCM10010233_15610 [Streptomyces gancidicus]GGS73098.1 hypothetical protein GCM10010285_59910 [Streptomyces rubiginosus]
MSSFGESLDPPPLLEPPPQAEAASARDSMTAPVAAARILRMAPGVPFREVQTGSAKGVRTGRAGATPHGLI